MFSLTLAPLNCIVSLPPCPSTVSLPSPGFHTNVSSPAPMNATSLPRPPLMRSLPGLPMRTSLPSPPFRVRPIDIRLETTRVDRVVAREGVDRELVDRRFAPGDVHRGGQARDRDAGRRSGNHDPVGIGRAVDDDGVGLPVAGADAGRRREVEVDLGDAGAGQVVDGDCVGAAQGVEVDLLDAIEVHGDVADVAEEPQPAAVGRQSIFSLTLEPLNCIVSLPPCPSTVSLPSPGFHTKVSSPAPMNATSLPRPPMMHVVAVAADQLVVAVAAGDRVVAGATVDRQLDHASGQSRGGDRVVAAGSVDDELVVGSFGALDRHESRQAGHGEAGPGAADLDCIISGGAVDDDGVGLAVAGAAPGRAGEVEVDAGDAGAGQVVDGEGVGAAQGDDVDLLDAVDVHGDVADVAGQPQPTAVGRQCHLLIDVGAVEQHRVVAALALDGVAAVAGVPDEGVVAGAHQGHVAAAAAVDQVVAVAADQDVVAVAAGDRVVPRAAVHGECDQRGQAIAGREGVVAAVHIDDQILARADVDAEGRRIEAVEADARAVRRDREVLGAVAAVDHDGVDAVAALVEVAAFAGVPDHPVVARLAEDLVGSRAAGQHVVAVAAEEQVVAALAEQGVVACLAEELVVAAAAGERVVAVAAEDVGVRQGAVGLVKDRLSLPPRPKIWIRLVLATVGAPPRTVIGAAVDQDRPGRVAMTIDRVVQVIADDRQQARRPD